MRSGVRKQFAGAVALVGLMLVSCGDDDDVGGLEAESGVTGEADVGVDDEQRGSEVHGPWPDVAACTLLPGDALTAVGIDDTEGRPPTDDPFDSHHCTWGRPPEETYVIIMLSGPVADVITEFDELYGQIAGRDTYVYTLGGELGCWMTTDNGDYSLKVTLHLEPSQVSELGPVCEATEPLAEAALSALG